MATGGYNQLSELDEVQNGSFNAGRKKNKRVNRIAIGVAAAVAVVAVIVVIAVLSSGGKKPSPAPATPNVIVSAQSASVPPEKEQLFVEEVAQALAVPVSNVWITNQTIVGQGGTITFTVRPNGQSPEQLATLVQQGLVLPSFPDVVVLATRIEGHDPVWVPTPPPSPSPTVAPSTPGPTTPPTNAPTPAPTSAPTSAPTLRPTASPSPPPTLRPVYDPDGFKMSFAALGDWGVTDDAKHDSVTNALTGAAYDRAFAAQKNVGIQMISWAKANKPAFVLSHGDNLYWTGVSDSKDSRFGKLYEQIYNDPSLYIPWYNVLGNHDYGGGSGFCGASCWSCGALCGSVSEMEAALNRKFTAQQGYKSPNNNRWVLTDHYYKVKHSYPVGSSNPDFSVEIFNIETNAAAGRLAETCCQCFSITSDCTNPVPGSARCVAKDQYDRCNQILRGWWTDSMTKLKADLATSTATWKIVQNHYLMKHFSVDQDRELRTIMVNGGVHIFFGGHEHAEGHDFNAQDGIHYVQNGAGGGAKLAGGTGNVWNSPTFAFVAGRVSKNYLEISFIDDYGSRKHCYNIPVNKADAILGFQSFKC